MIVDMLEARRYTISWRKLIVFVKKASCFCKRQQLIVVIGDKDTPNDQKISNHGYMNTLILRIYWIY